MHLAFMKTYVSVDCVVFGFNKNQLYTLLVQRNSLGSRGKDLKLPGSLIYQPEDADEAAYRVLNELTGIRKMTLRQFKSFTSPKRTSDTEDVNWLEFAYHDKIERLITVAYISLCKITRKLNVVSKYKTVEWCPIDHLPKMPFDHNQIVEESLKEVRNWVETEPVILFELLPTKFTATELRLLYEAIYNRKYDARNFHKKMVQMEYILPLDEYQENVKHRAARYYKFDRVTYNKRKIGI
ncbi:DNA mismatch repair protein MutT [Bacteroidia bacterium]|nr:DNA mismatch repair protein MutT [Bacteroidia bacterium]GHT27468.1 DNA mismatch repair protein MutT [Bacteroidia bacterium]GHT86270.1 DNA mismatch repair protein MutT [Bacteroidia bacterium]